MTRRLEGKRALITGAGTGIGLGIALEYAREGAAVALHYAHSAVGALAAVAEISQEGGKAVAYQADLADVEAVKRLGRQALEFLGGMDVLVNNSGITMNRPFEKVTPEQYNTVYNVNVRAPFFLTQTLLPALMESRGCVLNMSSVHAYEGLPYHSVYAGTKGALVAYTRELAIELAMKGVRVNAIAPGAIVVENHFKVDPNYDPEANGRTIPCGFEGVPSDIARVAVFLATDDARYIVGQTLVVDGGTTSWMPFNDGFRHIDESPYGRGYVPGV